MSPRFADQLERFFYRPDEEDAPLPALDAAEVPPAPRPADVPEELLAFLLEDECYGVPLRQVREIVRVPALTEVPRAPSNVIGVMNLRGEVVPVYDLKLRLKLTLARPILAGPEASALPRKARVVVLRSELGDAGVLVDSVLEVVRARPAEIEPPPAGSADHGVVVGLAPRRGGLCIVVDPERALA